ncbi:MAG: hypothetical protein HY784_11040 [Chloroflexi bacterium]|nr:hypothetical protein [Chloroflexota bacterium]
MARTPAAAARSTVPFQPACTSPTAPRRGSYSSTGTQSAKRISRVTSRRSVISPSACSSGVRPRWGRSARSTRSECTCHTSAMLSGSRPSAAKARRRLAPVCLRVSPVEMPKLSEAHGAGLTPPWRVKAAWASSGRRKESNWK